MKRNFRELSGQNGRCFSLCLPFPLPRLMEDEGEGELSGFTLQLFGETILHFPIPLGNDHNQKPGLFLRLHGLILFQVSRECVTLWFDTPVRPSPSRLTFLPPPCLHPDSPRFRGTSTSCLLALPEPTLVLCLLSPQPSGFLGWVTFSTHSCWVTLASKWHGCPVFQKPT